MNHKERSRTLSAFNTYRSIIERAKRLSKPFDVGMQWYAKARQSLKDMAESEPSVTLLQLSRCTAALSPLTPWNRNLQGTRQIVNGISQDFPRKWLVEIAKRYTVWNSNAVLAVETVIDNRSVSGPKVEPFARNLNGDLSAVTVDSWMFKTVGKFGLSSPAPTGNAQRAIVRAVKMCASLYDIQPAQSQAIVWVTERDFS